MATPLVSYREQGSLPMQLEGRRLLYSRQGELSALFLSDGRRISALFVPGDQAVDFVFVH